jgi:hypothetical protein
VSQRQPRNTAASVKQRLFNLARERGEDFNFLLTRYAVERLLYRIDQSKHANGFILKGAMLFHLGATPLPHRPTRDVDLLGKGSPDLARLKEIFRVLCGVKVADDGLVFDERTVRVDRIRDEEEYEGVRVRLEARMESARIPVQVDVGFGDALTPAPRKERLSALLDFPAPTLLVCPWETVIAEKFQAIVDLGMANSRMKDFFDLRYLSMTMTLDGATLSRAIRATFARRKTPPPTEVPTGLSPSFATDPVKQTQWRAFHRRLRLDGGKSLDDTLEALRAFLMPPVEAWGHRKPFRGTWRPGGPWRSDG